MTPNPRSRALDLAIPVASCAGAGVGTGHLLASLSREELEALADVLALAASYSPVRLRALIGAWDGMTPDLYGSEEERLRAAHAAFRRLDRAKLPVPLELRDVDSRYREMLRKRKSAATREAA